MSKCPKQLPKYLKKAERSVVLIVFNDVLYHVRAYTVTFIFVALHESGSRKAIMWSHRISGG